MVLVGFCWTKKTGGPLNMATGDSLRLTIVSKLESEAIEPEVRKAAIWFSPKERNSDCVMVTGHATTVQVHSAQAVDSFHDFRNFADGDCSHDITRHLLLGRKARTNLDRVLKSRDITLLTNVRIVKAMVFAVVMYGCESWTLKKADAFELWCWRRLLRVPWTARRSNQSILKEIGSEYSLEGLMLKLKLQYFGHLT